MEPSGSQAQPENEAILPLTEPAPAPDRCAQAGHALAINLWCGLRFACFLRVSLTRLCVSAEQLICLVVIDLLFAFASDFAAYGWPGRVNAWGLPGALFYLPLMLLAAVLIARRTGVPQLTLGLPIAWLAAAQYVSLATLLLSAASGRLDLTHRAVFLAYSWGPLAWWIAISAFVTYTLVPARATLKVGALGLVAILVVVPAWFMPRTSGGALWTALDDPTQDSRRFDSLASEEAFYAQPELLRRALDEIAPGMRGRTHLYFVGVAGYAEEDVFRKELKVITQLMQERFGAQGRTIELVNNPSTVLTTPVASRTSLARTLKHIGRVMNRDEDVLFLYLTSHGSEDHRFALSFWPLRLSDLDPPSLKQMLDAAGIRWRVVVVSACYAGGSSTRSRAIRRW